jgi:hypothetical protein
MGEMNNNIITVFIILYISNNYYLPNANSKLLDPNSNNNSWFYNVSKGD